MAADTCEIDSIFSRFRGHKSIPMGANAIVSKSLKEIFNVERSLFNKCIAKLTAEFPINSEQEQAIPVGTG